MTVAMNNKGIVKLLIGIPSPFDPLTTGKTAVAPATPVKKSLRIDKIFKIYYLLTLRQVEFSDLVTYKRQSEDIEVSE